MAKRFANISVPRKKRAKKEILEESSFPLMSAEDVDRALVLAEAGNEKEIFSATPLECDLLPMKKWLHFLPAELQPDEKRYGRYIGCDYSVPKGYYPVGVHISCDWEAQEEDKDEILQRCISHLNTPLERKKYAKKEPAPKYGKFCNKVIWSRFLPGKKIHAILAVNHPNSICFWEAAENHKETVQTIKEIEKVERFGVLPKAPAMHKVAAPTLYDEHGNPIKRKRGRPRKNPLPVVPLIASAVLSAEPPIKRKRGRPRKNPIL